MMTTLWPVLVLGVVSTLACLVPGLLSAASEKNVPEPMLTDDEDAVERQPEESGSWRILLIASTLPVILVLVLLWNAIAQSIGAGGRWFPVLILLPLMGTSFYAWRMRRQVIDRRN